MPWERRGGWKGERGCHTIRIIVSASAGRRGSYCVFVAVALKVVHVGQQTRKVTDRVSVVCPNNRKRLTFVGQDVVGCQYAHHGRQNALMKALHSSGRPYTVVMIGNLFIDEGGILMRDCRGLHRLQPVLVPRV